MRSTAWTGTGRRVAIAIFLAGTAAHATAQDFLSGKAETQWEHWRTALQAILDRDSEAAETAFGELLTAGTSPLRTALLAEHAVRRGQLAGAVLLFEQDAANGALGDNGQQIADLLTNGRERLNELDDGFWFASIGRFDVANANFEALLGHSPDPVAVLAFVDRDKRRRHVLSSLVSHPVIGQSIRGMIRVVERGELALAADPRRIRENIERLAGPPRVYNDAVVNLRASGEFAPPLMIQYLQDPQERELTRVIVRALPQIDRPALNPLVVALRMKDDTTNQYLIDAVGQIGYAQAVPYLLALREDQETSSQVRSRVDQALSVLAQNGVSVSAWGGAADAFFRLAEMYYRNDESLMADTRKDVANVWYWRDGILQNIEVPTPIFDEVMCMRACEESLRHNPDNKPALALWLAANLRREAQLPADTEDATRPENFGSGVYYAQSAGPEYCLGALARAVERVEPAVALGCIEALRSTAGTESLLTDASGTLPLAEALSFPDRLVRVRAALTLANGNPKQAFANSQNLMPVLAEALQLSGGAQRALVVDPDDESANRVADRLRENGYVVQISPNLNEGLRQARETMPTLDAIVLGSDIQSPNVAGAVSQLQGEFQFASIPIILLAKEGQQVDTRRLAESSDRLAAVTVEDGPGVLLDEINRIAESIGKGMITAELGTDLAIQAAQVLRELGDRDNPLFDRSRAREALVAALKTDVAELRIMAAEALAYVCSAEAQEPVAAVAFDDAENETIRIAMFDALAIAGKHCKNQLSDETITKLVSFVKDQPASELREAASRALGALNLPSNPASEIIRSRYQG